MFTGIIEALGSIRAITRQGADAQLTIATANLSMDDVHLGDSIAVNGVCLTVVAFGQDYFKADVSHETLARSSLCQLKLGSAVNLEKAMAANGRFGGHMVSGHVDGVATVQRIDNHGRSIDLWLKFPVELGRYIAEKGSITVDGISLTVNEVSDHLLRLTIIPHTSEQTTISQWRGGSLVNLEVDVVARYLERLLTGTAESTASHSTGLTMQTLAENGFLSGHRG
ncbi:riboflavin synthase [Celerinatantimonas sp. YJH-8]|uniref:riboflavin synthase n=1 Tax=Celerinatantimonas sp. YJH-8 TaxID=3228714 RepID=UPI0038C729C7